MKIKKLLAEHKVITKRLSNFDSAETAADKEMSAHFADLIVADRARLAQINAKLESFLPEEDEE